jgi:hypothetical protein
MAGLDCLNMEKLREEIKMLILHNVTRKFSGWILTPLICACFLFLSPNMVAGAGISTNIAGCIKINLGGGSELPVKSAKVKVYNDDSFSPSPLHQFMGEGNTDSQGCFNFHVNGDDWGTDYPDPYIKVEADSTVVVVKNNSTIFPATYCFRTPTKWDLPVDQYANFGTIYPDGSKDCTLGDTLSGQKGAWKAYSDIQDAFHWIRNITLSNPGRDPGKVTVMWPSWEVTNVSFFRKVFNEIHLANADAWDDGTIWHEYGHFILNTFSESPPPDYDNGICDEPDDPSHCLWREEKDKVHWTEGWPEYFEHVLHHHYGLMSPQQQQSRDRIPSLSGGETLPNTGDDPKLVEGYTGAILWDLVDPDIDEYEPYETLTHVSMYGWKDRLDLTFGDVWNTIMDCDPDPSDWFHNHPTSIDEFLDCFMNEFPEHANEIAEICHGNRIDIGSADLVLDPADGDFSISTNTIKKGVDSLDIYTRIYNVGSYKSPPTTMEVWISSGLYPPCSNSNASPLVTIYLPAIPGDPTSPYESIYESNITMDNFAGISAGTYHLCLSVDPGGNVFEGLPSSSLFRRGENNQNVIDDTTLTIIDDFDGDGYDTTVDCDDFNRFVHPGLGKDPCNGIDDNCDGNIDEGSKLTFYFDGDKDGFGDPNESVQACSAPDEQYVDDNTDCDDSRENINPGAIEVCNDADDNCNGSVDEGAGDTYFRDADGDFHGDPASPIEACNMPDGYIDNAKDCDDSNYAINSGASEVCNGVDDNCDSNIDEGFNSDGDEYTSCAGDCDDSDINVNPAAEEVCNGIDDNCDGSTDEGFDSDGDSVADCNDNCPADPGKTEPGICGCGVTDTDTDGDGTADCNDNCPDDFGKIEPGICGCSIADTDSDGDGTADCNDNCPADVNPDQSNVDADNAGDVCDVCPADGADACDQSKSSGESIGSSGGSVITPDVSIIVPPGALNTETSLSITAIGESYELVTVQGDGTALYGITIEPEGQEFGVPITIVFAWDDDDSDGIVDGTTVNEADLIITKDNAATTDLCINDLGCDTIANTFTFEVSSLSDFVLLVLNAPPSVGEIIAPIEPVQLNTEINVSVSFTDPGFLDTHAAVWDWGDSSTSHGAVLEISGAGNVEGSHIYADAGIYTLTLTVTDNHGESCTTMYQYVVVYDPSSGFVTGGGWIDSPVGAYTADQTLTGRANFGFVSKYKKGATTPIGTTEFQFKMAELNFHSDSYEWLVVAGPQAKFKGVGTINGSGNYGFMISAVDSAINGGEDADKFRIKIWDKDNNDLIVYDNMLEAADDAETTTVIGGGSIVIHKGKSK